MILRQASDGVKSSDTVLFELNGEVVDKSKKMITVKMVNLPKSLGKPKQDFMSTLPSRVP